MHLKERLLKHCRNYVQKKQDNLQFRRKMLNESLRNETKSTAGDKHETGRAMVQLEQEKLGKQEKELEVLYEILQRINMDRPTPNVSLGSFVKTSSYSYFLAIFADAFEQAGEKVFCISTASPIGQCLLGKKQDDTFQFNGKIIKILEIE
ncbi:MAG: GreA/GreB family elongation factor [Bacteroidota bacterium]